MLKYLGLENFKFALSHIQSWYISNGISNGQIFCFYTFYFNATIWVILKFTAVPPWCRHSFKPSFPRNCVHIGQLWSSQFTLNANVQCQFRKYFSNNDRTVTALLIYRRKQKFQRMLSLNKVQDFEGLTDTDRDILFESIALLGLGEIQDFYNDCSAQTLLLLHEAIMLTWTRISDLKHLLESMPRGFWAVLGAFL